MDTRIDIERDKYLEWKEQKNIAMSNACEQCSERTPDCPFYDSEEDYYDYEECFKVRGWE